MTDPPKPTASDPLAIPSRLAVGIALTTDPQMTRGLLEQFCLALSDATGIEVVPRGVSSYRRLLEQLQEGDVDIVWLPPIPALHATAEDRVVPFALPIRNGASSYAAALFGPQHGRYRRIEDLDGVKAAWVDPQSAAGYLIIRAHLLQLGVDLDKAFAEDVFLGSHDAVAEAVVNGRADVGATFAYLDDDGEVSRAGWGHARVQLIAHAGPIPNDVIAARKGLSNLLIRLVQSALIDVQNAQLRQAARSLLAAEGFSVPKPEHLEPLRELLAAMASTDQRHSLFPPASRT